MLILSRRMVWLFICSRVPLQPRSSLYKVSSYRSCIILVNGFLFLSVKRVNLCVPASVCVCIQPRLIFLLFVVDFSRFSGFSGAFLVYSQIICK